MNTREVSLTGIPRMGKVTVIGALIGALSVAVPVAAFLLYISAEVTTIVAGVHVGFFGGMGYGGMLGAVIQADRYERTERALLAPVAEAKTVVRVEPLLQSG